MLKCRGHFNKFTDVQTSFLLVKSEFIKSDETNLQYHPRNHTQRDEPVFVKNVLHSLFSESTVTARRFEITEGIGICAQIAFMKTETSGQRETEGMKMKCQT